MLSIGPQVSEWGAAVGRRRMVAFARVSGERGVWELARGTSLRRRNDCRWRVECLLSNNADRILSDWVRDYGRDRPDADRGRA